VNIVEKWHYIDLIDCNNDLRIC